MGCVLKISSQRRKSPLSLVNNQTCWERMGRLNQAGKSSSAFALWAALTPPHLLAFFCPKISSPLPPPDCSRAGARDDQPERPPLTAYWDGEWALCLCPQRVPSPNPAAAWCLVSALGFVKNEAFLICWRWQTSSCHRLKWCVHSFLRVTNNGTKILANSSLSLLPRIVWAQLIPSAPSGSRYRLTQFWNAEGPQPCKAWSNPDWSPWKVCIDVSAQGAAPARLPRRNQPRVGIANRLCHQPHPTAPALEWCRQCPRTAAGHGPSRLCQGSLGWHRTAGCLSSDTALCFAQGTSSVLLQGLQVYFSAFGICCSHSSKNQNGEIPVCGTGTVLAVDSMN